jgi:hypothetical protein
MHLIAITDIHGRECLGKTAAKPLCDGDLVLIAGDITNFGGKSDAELIIKEIKAFNENILAIPGNCDQHGVNEVLQSNQIDLHTRTRKIEDIAFYGIGGCSKTPFHTPQEYSESEIEKMLNCFQKSDDARFHVLVSHSPPAKTKVDRVLVGLHVGSKAVRRFIEELQPDLVICGHIHEARGIDKIGKSIIINPGPFPKHYAIINMKETISYELH